MILSRSAAYVLASFGHGHEPTPSVVCGRARGSTQAETILRFALSRFTLVSKILRPVGVVLAAGAGVVADADFAVARVDDVRVVAGAV